MEGDEDRELEVRSLTGESIIVSISASKTVEDLKELLQQKFKPASVYPNFHLYFKGTKLSPKTRLDCQAIGRGSFIVIIPFIKKDTNKAKQPSDPLVEKEQGVGKSSSVSLADLAWQDIMNDMSELRDISNDAAECSSLMGNPGSGMTYEKGQEGFNTRVFEKARISEEGVRDDLIVSILQLQSPNKNALLGENCETLVRVLEMEDCLLDEDFRECLLYRKSRLLNNCASLCTENNSSSCICPSWLKAVLRAFTFLNIVSAYRQQQRTEMTWDFLTKVMVHVENSGLQIGVENLRSLSLLCPKIIKWCNQMAYQH